MARASADATGPLVGYRKHTRNPPTGNAGTGVQVRTDPLIGRKQRVSSKRIIMIAMTLGSTLGSWVPTL